MALEKIRPRVVDATGNYTFNDVTLTGNVSAPTANIGNLTGVNNLVASSTTINVSGSLSTTANISAGNIKTDHLLYANGVAWAFGQLSVAGANTQVQFNDSSSFGASANLTFNKDTSTLTVTKISSNGALLTNLTGANVTGTVANATYAISAGTATTATTSGTVTTAAQPNITSVGTLTSLDVTGNITAGNASLGNLTTSNFFSGNGSLLTSIAGANVTGAVAYATTANAVAGANVSGQVSYAATANAVAGANVLGQVGNALVAGTVYANSQPNITSVGTLTTLTVGNATANSTFGNGTITASGNISFTGANVSLGSASNLHITGGTSGYFLTTDGTGNLSWGSASGAGGVTASGSNTYVQFNDAGVLGSSANFAFDKSTNIFTVDRAVHINGANLGSNVSNVYIGGGSSNQILKTDGAGNLSWTSQSQTIASTTVDTFTGDGTTTAFTLSVTPASINQTVVNYNGAFQLREAYTITGATITFSAAPASGSKIEVTTTKFDNLSASSSSFVSRSYTGTGSQTDFTVTTGCTVGSVVVTENGVVQAPTTDYTISGTTLSFTTAPGNGTKIQIRELAVAVTTVAPNLTWNIANSNITMVVNNAYFVDTSGGAKTMTLPTSATLGDTIRINDLAGSFNTNNLTVARNGHKIQGATSDLLVDVNQSSFGLVYSNPTYGWKVLDK